MKLILDIFNLNFLFQCISSLIEFLRLYSIIQEIKLNLYFNFLVIILKYFVNCLIKNLNLYFLVKYLN